MNFKSVDELKPVFIGRALDVEKNNGYTITEQSDEASVEAIIGHFGATPLSDGESLSRELENTSMPYLYKEDDLTNIDLLKGKAQMYKEREARIRGEEMEALEKATREAQKNAVSADEKVDGMLE